MSVLLLIPAGVCQAVAATQEPVAHAAASEGAVAGEHGAETEHEGWLSTAAKVVNFAVLVGALVYFLKTPIALHLSARSQTIRRELEDAAALRASAEQSLHGVRDRLARLPGELDSLRTRGQQELADESVRMKTATSAQRTALQETTAREIALQLRVARRALLEHAADRAMALAETRIAQSITAVDQAHLLDAYVTEVRS